MFGEGDGLADLLLERIGERFELGGVEPGRRGDVGGDFAAMSGGQVLEGGDDRRQGEQPPAAGDDLDEIAHRGVRLGLGQHDAHGLYLFLGVDHRGAQEAREIGAFIGEGEEPVEPLLDVGHRIVGLGEIEQRRRIRPRDLGQHRILLCQCRSTLLLVASKPARNGQF